MCGINEKNFTFFRFELKISQKIGSTDIAENCQVLKKIRKISKTIKNIQKLVQIAGKICLKNIPAFV